MLSRTNHFRCIIIFTLVSFFFSLSGCKNLSGKEDSITDTASAAQTEKSTSQKPKITKIKETKPKATKEPEQKKRTTSVKSTKNPKRRTTRKNTNKQETLVNAQTPSDVQTNTVTANVTPADIIPDDGYIRLAINENNGSFSLFYLIDPQKMRYEPLFNPNDSSASFLSVSVDGKIYKLGVSNQFKSRIERINKDTSLIFESSFLKVTQVFSPVRTTNSQAANGVKITIIVKNTGTERSFVGVKLLLDTDLGEGVGGTPILTNTQVVKSELLIEGNTKERYWISRGKNISLMGSIVNPIRTNGKGPDYVHFANWRRLRDAEWFLPYSQGRSFNNLPNTVDDSAVCYLFEPRMLDKNKIFTYTVFLTTEDPAWYDRTETINIANITPLIISDATMAKSSVTQTPKKEALTINIPAIEAQAQKESVQTGQNADAIVLLKLQDILTRFVDGQIFLKESDLLEIDRTIEKYRLRNISN